MIFPTDADRKIFIMNKEEFLKTKRIDDLDSFGNLEYFDVSKDEFDKFCEIVNKTTSVRLLTDMKIYLHKHRYILFSTLTGKRKARRKIEDSWSELTKKYLDVVEEQESNIIDCLRKCAYKELNNIHKTIIENVDQQLDRKEILKTIEHLIYRTGECKSAEQIFLILIDAETFYLN